jgi:5'-3' exonuclease
VIKKIDNKYLIDDEYLMIDFNSIIHNTMIDKTNDIDIINGVNDYIINLLKMYDLNKLKYVYIAVDGVPTFAKILESKK